MLDHPGVLGSGEGHERGTGVARRALRERVPDRQVAGGVHDDRRDVVSMQLA